jgi:hypothetical protein
MDNQAESLVATMMKALGSFVPLAADAFEAGTDVARDVRELLGERLNRATVPNDPWHYCHTVRLFVKGYLLREGYLPKDYCLDDLAMSGLRLQVNGWDLRIRKAMHDGSIPLLGTSKRIKAFCQQSLPGDFSTFGGRNALMLWQAIPNGGYTGLSLIYLQGEDSARAQQLARVDFPAGSHASAWIDAIPEVEDLPLESAWIDPIQAVGDLPLELDDSEETSDEQAK